MLDKIKDSLLDPSVAFSGYVLTLLGNIKALQFKIFAHTSIEELSFMSRNIKVFRKLLLNVSLSLFLCIYTVFLFTLDFDVINLYTLVSQFNFTIYISIFLFTLIYLIILLIPFIQKKVAELIMVNRKSRRKHSSFVLITICMMLTYSLCVLFLYAIIVINYLKARSIDLLGSAPEEFDFLLSSALYSPKIVFQLLFFTLLCILFLSLLPFISKYLADSEVVICITFKDNTILENKHIINPNVRNGILVSDSKDSFSKKIYIPNENIKKIDFLIIQYFLGIDETTIKPVTTNKNKLVSELINLSEKEKKVVEDILQNSMKCQETKTTV
ncbi:hypothetical protein J40TS1_05820 [Paenibacillus montaniterrae]|uniref:Uncharacterized protein n=1 Tax=Paenibacillus montaniterrae TaxID=429341 RepID=A0A919YK56_9BACL|nr:hypothetical protein [Paenibacillus montaniterrae]GIP14940.1 hypothetical protein J40TS1_05820 [Paenibacillus montaniterrae]